MTKEARIVIVRSPDPSTLHELHPTAPSVLSFYEIFALTFAGTIVYTQKKNRQIE